MLCHLQFDSHGWYAHARLTGEYTIPIRYLQLYTYVSKTTGTLLWQITNQSLNVAINSANANKSTPLSTSTMVQSYFLAVSASCTVALGLNALVPRIKRLSPTAKMTLTRLVPFAAVASAGALNVFLMRGEEIRQGIDVFPVLSENEKLQKEKDGVEVQSLGKSKKAATLAVGETAISRVLNATPIMVLPPLILVRLQQMDWLKKRPRLTLPVNLGMMADCHALRHRRLTPTYRFDLNYFDFCFAPGIGSLPPATSSPSTDVGEGILEQKRQRRDGGI